jgi:hypothetical protein
MTSLSSGIIVPVASIFGAGEYLIFYLALAIYVYIYLESIV